MTSDADEQLALVASPKKRKSRARVDTPAEKQPIARVVIDTPVPHLDRVFDYIVPERLDGEIVVGCRVRVRLSGRLTDGYVLDRVDETDHEGRLGYVERGLGESVLTAEIAALAREVADRQAGVLADVLRLAVPPRHVAAEREMPGRSEPVPVPAPDAGSWSRYDGGRDLLAAIHGGDPARAVWSALPGPTWPREIAVLVDTALAAGRSAVVVVPDARDVERVARALDASGAAERFVTLTAELGPAERYRRFLALRRGHVAAVVGTRAAVFAPVRSPLGVVVVWDEGDDALAEPRAPYPHAREVAALRAHRAGCAFVAGGLARSAEAQAFVASGWATTVAAKRGVVRGVAPRVIAAGDDVELERDPAARSARLPTVAWRAAREAIATGAPVLVQVPRRGYVPALSCARCHARARCAHCAGPLSLTSGHAVPSCRWCGRPAAKWTCPTCSGTAVRAAVIGARRTAEELGRALPGVPVRTSGGDSVLDRVTGEPALVIATPGAEPVADTGYGAVLLLDTWALLGRSDLRAAEEALRRWFGAAALARSASEGGRVVVVGDASLPAVQALIRWDPGRAAERELAERVEVGLPPAVRIAEILGRAADIAEFLAAVELPAGAVTMGPVSAPRTAVDPDADGPDQAERVLVRVPRRDGTALAAALHAAVGGRSASRPGRQVRVRLDPVDLG